MAAKKCLICSSAFHGRADALTCSARCRKRLQLLRQELRQQSEQEVTGYRLQVTGKTKPKAPSLKKALALLAFGIFGLLALLLGSGTPRVEAAASTYLNFQARLLTSSGSVVPDGDYNIEFKIYDADSTTGPTQGTCTGNANCLWVETRTGADQVRVVNGYFSVKLGEANAFPGTINWDQQLWLTMNIGGTGTPSWDGEMQNSGHSIQLTAVPLAFTANQLATTNGNRGTLSFASLGQATDITLPDPSASTATVCYQNATACGFAPSTGGSGYVQLQGSTPGTQQSGNFNIDGTGIVGDLTFGSTQGTFSYTSSTTGSTLNPANDVFSLYDGANQQTLRIWHAGDSYLQLQAPSSFVGTATISTESNTTDNTSNILLRSGTQLGNSLSSGSVTIQSGDASGGTNSSSGNVTIDSGAKTGSGTTGLLNLGTTNASAINLGNTTSNILTTVNGTALFKPTTGNDSTTAFEIQDAAGTSNLFVADTVNNYIGIGTNSPGATLDVEGPLENPAFGFSYNTVFTDSAAAAQNVGGGISFAGNADTNRTFAVIQGYHESSTASNYAGALQFLTRPNGGNPTRVFNLSSTGQALFKNQADSTSAFQVQNSSSYDVMAVDTSSNHLKIYDGTATAAYVDIYYDDATSSAVFAASSGTTKIGNGTGAITLNAGSGAAINITGHAASTWQTDAGSLQIQGGTTLTLLSTGSNAASLDSSTTGGVNVGTGSNAKTITIGNTTGATAVTIDSGTGNIDIGTGAQARTLNFGTGAAAQTVTIGSTTSSSALTLQGGSGNITLNTSSGNKVQIGSSTTDANSVIIVLDSYNSSTEPTGVTGAMYFNTSLNQFRCYGANGVAGWSDCSTPPSLSYSIRWDDDFQSSASDIGQLGWQDGGSGTGSGVSNVTSIASRPGVIDLHTGTTTSGTYELWMGGATASTTYGVVVPGGNMTIEFAIKIPTLPSGSDHVKAFVGMGDQNVNATSLGNNAISLSYDDTVSANWQCITKNGGTATTNTSSSTVDTNWHYFKIVLNAAANTATFYIDGASQCTNSTNVPTSAMMPMIYVIKNGGTTSLSLQVDYWSLREELSSAR